MKNWKQFTIVAVFLLIGGTFYVNAQDMIILKDGNMIEAKVEEISPLEIRYKRFDHLDGPTIVVPSANVLSIRYENGTYEIINADTTEGQKNVPAEKPQKSPGLDPNKFIFAFNANAGGALLAGTSMRGSGPSVCFEFSKGKFNSEINLIIPVGSSIGFGGLATFNYFWHSRIGGFYLGGGLGYIHSKYTRYRDFWDTDSDPWVKSTGNVSVTGGNFTFGLNAGYKFVTKSGVYFRTGAYVGLSIISENGNDVMLSGGDGWASSNAPVETSVYFKPDLTIGYAFK